MRFPLIIYVTMYRLFQALWSLFCCFSFFLQSSIPYSFRVYPQKGCQTENSESTGAVSEPENEDRNEDSKLRRLTVKETNFQNQVRAQISKSRGEETEQNSVAMGHVLSVCNNKYEFSRNRGFRGFVEEPKVYSCVVHEVYVDSENIKDPLLIRKPAESLTEEKLDGSSEEWKTEKSNMVSNLINDDSSRKQENFDGGSFTEVTKGTAMNDFLVKGDILFPNCLLNIREKDEAGLENFRLFDRKMLEIDSGIANDLTEDSDEFIELTSLLGVPNFSEEGKLLQNGSNDLAEHEQQNFENYVFCSSEEDENAGRDNRLQKNESVLNLEEDDSAQGLEESAFKEKFISDLEEADDSDDENEHELLMQQLKNELNKGRCGGLPTIPEESEAQESLRNLEPLKVDGKLESRDGLNNIRKVHKNYTEKMRKLDARSAQTMHAIGLTRLKDSNQSTRDTDASTTIGKLWPFKQQRWESDQIIDLHADLEIVYVGQLCLSWDMLQWEYVRLVELLHEESQGFYTYSQTADEFQFFKVLIQRFIEDEPFQIQSRVDNHVRSRRNSRKFLQVPAIISDDDRFWKKRIRQSGDRAFKISALRESIWETIHIFWNFICRDKHNRTTSIPKSHHQTQVSPQEPSDTDLLTSVQSKLAKKQRKVKQILRNNPQGMKLFHDDMNSTRKSSDVLFMTRMELKLISRVLNMSKIRRDHIIWCQNRLDRIKFESQVRNVYLEPLCSFFPC